MKTLAASQEGPVLVDFWATDISGYYESYELRWERWDEREPDVRGLETLKLSMLSAWPGQTWTLPSQDLRVDYTMATPAKGQGARAVELRGVISVVEGKRVWIDLTARMERLDAPGVEFDEAIRGMFALTK
ncbi:MAG TPA: hypothetical protein VF950_19255 [Planctomycetota bacterium]